MYIFIDTETGGLNYNEHSLLSVGFIVTDNDLNMIDKKEYFIKNDKYICELSAMTINKINIMDCIKNGIDNNQLYNVLNSYGNEKNLVWAGWNVMFDVQFLSKFLNGKLYFGKYMDVKSIYIDYTNNQYTSYSLDSASKQLEIVNNKPHNAMSDIETTFEIYKRIHDRRRN